MKSVKPGRAPSMMGGFVCIGMAVIGIVFLIVLSGSSNSFYSGFPGGFGGMSAGGFGASSIGIVFCIIFIIIAIAMAVYNFINATKRNRYSVLDITEGGEEPDPLNQRFGNTSMHQQVYKNTQAESSFCPYCGAQAQGDFEFCNVCGKKLP
jgi:uncharacterized membrane protein